MTLHNNYAGFLVLLYSTPQHQHQTGHIYEGCSFHIWTSQQNSNNGTRFTVHAPYMFITCVATTIFLWCCITLLVVNSFLLLWKAWISSSSTFTCWQTYFLGTRKDEKLCFDWLISSHVWENVEICTVDIYVCCVVTKYIDHIDICIP